MVKKINMEIDDIWKCIEDNKNFLLSGGAGSGKTYTLVNILRKITQAFPNQAIACITYTNAAVNEIKSRIDNKNLKVSTIHEFLWSCVSNYQTELKKTLQKMFPSEEINSEKDIQYKEYKRLGDGIITHDDVICLAEQMFKEYPKLGKILMDSYPFIMVDEYQDTEIPVVNILLHHLNKQDFKGRFVVGFFGDAMQSIYNNRVGNLNEYLQSGLVSEIQIKENRRNPQAVINLANKLRTDHLVQNHSDEISAPNMDKTNGMIKLGKAAFLYSKNPDLDNVRKYLVTNSDFLWDNNNIKELHLTKKLIATKAGFPTLHSIYKGDAVYCFVKDFQNRLIEQDIEIDDNEKFESVFNKYGSSIYKDIVIPILNLPWKSLKDMYVKVDMLMDNKTIEEDIQSSTGTSLSKIVDYILKIMQLIDMYINNKVGDFLKKTDYKIKTFADKKRLSECMNSLSVNNLTATIGDAISICEKMNLIEQSDGLISEIESNTYIFNSVCRVPFIELIKLYEYKERYSPYSTLHGVKGAEFDYVLVNLDNGRWPDYNFKALFKDGSPTESVMTSTLNLFYVCCTRAKEGLAVFMHNPSNRVIMEAKQMFGENNVIDIDK